jgi:hypothetical protein
MRLEMRPHETFQTVSELPFSETGLLAYKILGNRASGDAGSRKLRRSEGIRRGPGYREPRRKVRLGLPCRRGVIVLLAQPTVTMTVNNKAVKGCGRVPHLFTEVPRRGVLGNLASSMICYRKL